MRLKRDVVWFVGPGGCRLLETGWSETQCGGSVSGDFTRADFKPVFVQSPTVCCLLASEKPLMRVEFVGYKSKTVIKIG